MILHFPQRQLPLHRQCSGPSWGAIPTFPGDSQDTNKIVWHFFWGNESEQEWLCACLALKIFLKIFEVMHGPWCFFRRQLVHLLRWMIWTLKHQSSKRRTAPQRLHRKKNLQRRQDKLKLKGFHSNWVWGNGHVWWVSGWRSGLWSKSSFNLRSRDS